MIKLSLAIRAIVTRPPGLDDPLNSALAVRRRTSFAFSVIDGETVLEIPKLATDGAIVAKRRPTGSNGIAQNVSNKWHEFLDTTSRNAIASACR